MSNEIQSISQGNYILQGTVATSAGIVGDGTTQNPLRVDETVLWDGSQQVIGTTNKELILSESASNFAKLRIYFHGSAQNEALTSIDIVMISRADAYYTLSVTYTNDNSGTLFVDACSVQIDGTSFTVARGFRKGITTSISSETSKGPTILKVIGINRIANN